MALEIQKKIKQVTEPEQLTNAFLVETAWEVCNQVGGIYTVIRSKVPVMTQQWGDRYCLLGPIIEQDVSAEFDPITDLSGPVGKAVDKMRGMGYSVLYGTWLITGRPKVVLVNVNDVAGKLDMIRNGLKVNHGVDINADDHLQSQVISFATLSKIFIALLSKEISKRRKELIAHFHEWMSSLPILDIQKEELPVHTIFTTHATSLGRYLAMNDDEFYNHLGKYDWKESAQRFHITPIAQIERFSAQKAHVLTTVSDVTARECKVFYGRDPDYVTPNGLNIERFVAYHEVQNLHQEYKDVINQFVMGHFFHCSPFDLDKTIYFFTSGRYEYRNKGFDITLEALSLLNNMMKKAKMEQTVVMFFITKKPVWSINPVVMQFRGVMEEIRKNCESIQSQIGDRLFYAAASEENDFRLPDLNELVDDYWRLRYRRILQSWKTKDWPIVVTHNLKNDESDEILNYLRDAPLVNSPDDKVKVVYHPDFIDSTNPLFGIDYGEFVRGCHLGVFPSYYEPWGYTPLECIARGVPTITSDYSGFGDFVGRYYLEHEKSGVYLINRFKKKHDRIVKNLAKMMFNFIKLTRRERMLQRNKAEDLSEDFDWSNLIEFYNMAYVKSMQVEAKV